MQQVAAENNLSETAFFVEGDDDFHIRWFTPRVEVDLCGHATLATAHVIFNHYGYKKNNILFQSRSGELKVRKENGLLVLNFPADTMSEVEIPSFLTEGLGATPQKAFKGKTDYMLVFDSQEQVESIRPDFKMISQGNTRGIIVTAPGNDADFVSRFFGPNVGVDEDPVTGSAHTSLIPYWSARLDKKEMSAIQLSARRGYLSCKYLNDRVEMGGKAVTFLAGEYELHE
jgi:PhzF family phenazine biosynthesis protein